MLSKQFKARAIIVVVLVAMLVISIILTRQPQVERWDYHAVDTGDTLWNIAEEHNPGYKGDIREITYRIKKANGMKNDTVYVGDLIMVPVVET